MSVIQISSDSLLNDTEHHFRVSAGPGAGKTHWLVGHIKSVLHNSKRLAKCRKIACITYTNIAVETILNRLGTSSDRVEVSTIHSFLYKNILKPYGHFIASQYSLDIQKMDGHDDIIPTNYGFINEWKIRTGQQRIKDDKVVIAAFRNLKWKFDASGVLVVKTDYPFKPNNYPIKNDSYLQFKKMRWEKGLVHHDDVLFFSYQIIRQYPYALEVLRAKFPYFFIDEFQDSNPIQISILKSIMEKESTFGIVGDKAQSIYGFLGADPTQFYTFNLPGMIDYGISTNRRSTNEIIDLLNTLRSDIVQTKHRNSSILSPTIFVGPANVALKKARILCGSEILHSLSRENITSNAMKMEISGINFNSKLFDELREVDSNSDRCSFLISCIKAIELSRQKKFGDAIKELQRLFRYKLNKQESKRMALSYILMLLDKHSIYSNATMFNFSEFVRTNIKSDLSKVTRGETRKFYDSHSYKDLALCVKIQEDVSHHKTIHKAKGDEFDNVLLILMGEEDLEFILASNLRENEEHRINYVAVSRAKNRLFISIPTLSVSNESLLVKFQVERI